MGLGHCQDCGNWTSGAIAFFVFAGPPCLAFLAVIVAILASLEQKTRSPNFISALRFAFVGQIATVVVTGSIAFFLLAVALLDSLAALGPGLATTVSATMGAGGLLCWQYLLREMERPPKSNHASREQTDKPSELGGPS